MGRRRSNKEGMYIHIELTHFVAQQKLTQHCKTTIAQLKIYIILHNVYILLFHVKVTAELNRKGHLHMPEMKREHIIIKVCSF